MMMLMGEGQRHHTAIHAPPWQLFEGTPEAVGYAHPLPLACGDCTPYLVGDAAMQRHPPAPASEAYDSDESEMADAPVDAYSCDEFRMYEFKVRRCARGRSHDWTECPYAHPGEKARRRDPRKYHYSGTACPDFRKGSCKRGDQCEFAHGVFECWLHPARYRTQPCKDGTACRRRVCFFAHTPDQLRVLPHQQQQQQQQKQSSVVSGTPESYDGSPLRRHTLDAYFPTGWITSSPTSTLISPPMSPPAPADSPPVSPSGGSVQLASGSTMNDVLASLRQLQLSKVKSMPSSWGLQMGGGGGVGVFGSPRRSGFRAGFCSLPSTPTKAVGGGARWLEAIGGDDDGEEEPMERVESGRPLRAKMFERVIKENGLEKPGADAAPAPDVGWISELLK